MAKRRTTVFDLQALGRSLSRGDPRAYYEAGRRDPQRKQRREPGSANTALLRAGTSLREQARHLDQNHDLVRGILDTLVQNVVGANGIGIEPQPRRTDGSIHDELARKLLLLWRDWQRLPEVTRCLDWAAAQRLVVRSWLRDGESLAQVLDGDIRYLDHGTEVPLSLELIESDLLPLDYHSTEPRITAGVELNGWGRPVAYHLYRSHPGDSFRWVAGTDLKRVPASRLLHLKLIDRIGQTRGATLFAPVMLRLDDIKDYEESERIAAKVAASMAAYIRKGSPDIYDNRPEIDADGKTIEPAPRDMRFRPGMVFDDLEPGEEIGTIDTKRPNPNLELHRRGQLRAVASGTRVTYSSASKDYDGSYSSQRQELVEGFGAYAVLASDFIGAFVQPIWERFVSAARISGALRVPAGIDLITLDDALFIPPQAPWIDPEKEANAWLALESAGYASAPEIIRRRGQNPLDVLEQEKRWRRLCDEAGLSFAPASGRQDPNMETNNARTRTRA